MSLYIANLNVFEI